MKQLYNLTFFIAVIISAAVGASTEKQCETASATVPLEEVLRLYEENAEARKKPVAQPPVSATLSKIELEGQLLEDGIDIKAEFEVTVLSSGKWVCVPLFRKDASICISEVPSLEGAAIGMKDGYFSLITSREGVYSFTISMIKWADRKGKKLFARMEFSHAIQAQLHLLFDEDLFSVLGKQMVHDAEGVLVYPKNNAFPVSWEQRRASMIQKTTTEKRPPIESMVQVARASSVSTLEGRLITRTVYKLRFEGTKSISFHFQDGDKLEHAYLNGNAIPFQSENDSVTLNVFPLRAGDRSGTVELVTSRQMGNYMLSGVLEFTVPRASWPTHEVYLECHLPKVFNYRCSGGSMAAAPQAEPVDYTYSIPQPGKKISFHQNLVTIKAPTVRVEYAIDLEGNYFN